MPLTPTQRGNLGKVKDFLDLIRRLCPGNPRIDELIGQWDRNIENDWFEFDTERVEAAEPSAPGHTENKRNIYIREDLSPGEFDLATPGGVFNLVNLLATVVHEMFHQLCSRHPTTYTETADFLRAVIDCLRQNRDDVKQHFNWGDAMFNGLIDQLEIHEREERDKGQPPAGGNGGGRDCFIAGTVYGPSSAEVTVLRRYRDETMSNGWVGQSLVAVYYRVSPYWVRAVRRSAVFAAFTRSVLDAIVRRLGSRDVPAVPPNTDPELSSGPADANVGHATKSRTPSDAPHR